MARFHRKAGRAGGPKASSGGIHRALLPLFASAVVAAAFAPPLTAADARAHTATERRANQNGTAVDARYFAPGSCREFRPTAGDRHLTVFLDAGHGGIDPGGVGQTQSGQTIYEKSETLPVELDTMALLRAQGFTVVVSRTDDNTVARPGAGDVSGGLFTAQGVLDDLAARDVCANGAKADVLLGIYFDAGASQYNAGSVTGYDTDRPFSADNLRFATLVQLDVLSVMNAQGWGIPNEGVVDDSALGGPALTTESANYGHLQLLGPADPGYFSTPSTMPGALVEPLFITDPYEGSLAATTTAQKVIAGGLAEAVEQYFGPPPTKSDKKAKA